MPTAFISYTRPDRPSEGSLTRGPARAVIVACCDHEPQTRSLFLRNLKNTLRRAQTNWGALPPALCPETAVDGARHAGVFTAHKRRLASPWTVSPGASPPHPMTPFWQAITCATSGASATPKSRRSVGGTQVMPIHVTEHNSDHEGACVSARKGSASCPLAKPRDMSVERKE
jgi:hypothetical protein